MELAAQTRIPFPRDLVFATIRDRMPELAGFMPNIKQIEMKERRDADPLTHFINTWTASTEIPAIAQRYLKPDMLKWTDYAKWDRSNYSCDWKTVLVAWPDVLECGGTNVYNAFGDETELQIRGNLHLHLEHAPIPKLFVSTVRPIVERIVIASLKPNLLSIGDAVAQYLAKQKAAATS